MDQGAMSRSWMILIGCFILLGSTSGETNNTYFLINLFFLRKFSLVWIAQLITEEPHCARENITFIISLDCSRLFFSALLTPYITRSRKFYYNGVRFLDEIIIIYFFFLLLLWETDDKSLLARDREHVKTSFQLWTDDVNRTGTDIFSFPSVCVCVYFLYISFRIEKYYIYVMCVVRNFYIFV